MIETLKSYDAYKDSGVPSLGDLPTHWDVRRQRNAVDMRVSSVDKHSNDGESPVRLCNYVDVYKNDRITKRLSFMRATATPEEVERFRLHVGDVLITKDSETWDDIGVPSLVEYTGPDLLCGYHLALLRPRNGILTGQFLLRAHQSPAIAYQYHVSANGVTRYGLSHDAIKSIHLPIPSPPEQVAIARFLDYVERRIRRYTRAKRKLMVLLTEQKQAIVHRAVTRGLNAAAPLKPSGLDWLGDIPDHWEVRRNGRLFAQRNETNCADLPILEVSLRTGVRIRDFDNSPRKQVMSDRDKYKRAAAGDIAYNMMRMWQGAVGVAPVDGLVSPAYVVARPLAGTDSRYFSSLFRTPIYTGEVDKFSRGIVKDRNRLYWEDFKQMPSPYPPPEEQRKIAHAIERDTGNIDAAIDCIRREIATLNEYRTRIIADVVSGRMDVRAAAARLPDEPAEPEAAEDDELDEAGEGGEEAGPDQDTDEAAA